MGWIVNAALNRLTRPARSLAGGTPADYGLPFERVAFASRDGTVLRGWFVAAPAPRATLVFCHGHAGSKAPDLQYVPWLRERGYNVLLFDFRAHGESDGKATSLVYYEREDLLAAIAYLRGRGIPQVGLMGFSMGAAVALATAPLSDAVRAVIADSGFAELRTIVRNGLQNQHVLDVLVGPLSSLIMCAAGHRLGCQLPESDPLRWVERIAPRPLLIVHGGQDRDVPASEAYRLYQAAREPKELWIVDAATHRCADRVCPQEYVNRVLAFLDRWLVPTRDVL
jgi:fermentation-respiration switch protein FrsA (DUF1100 family)